MTDAAQQGFLRKSAWKFLIRYAVCALPVDVFRLCGDMAVILRTYADLSALISQPESYIHLHYDPDGFAVWSRRDQAFLIYYNQAVHETVKRWTLMHELAHIHLGHIRQDAFYTRTKRQSRQWLEEEADGFTRRVLCPSIVLHEIQALTPQAIARCCGISMQAASYRARLMAALELRNLFFYDPLEKQVAQQFSDYIREQQKQLHSNRNIKAIRFFD